MREFAALRHVWRDHQYFLVDLTANLRADLHNLWTSGKRYTAADFTGRGGVTKPRTWQDDAAVVASFAESCGGQDVRGLPKDDKEQVLSNWLRRAYDHRGKIEAGEIAPSTPRASTSFEERIRQEALERHREMLPHAPRGNLVPMEG